MSAAAAMVKVSIGDEGVLNREVSQSLAEVWLDRDMSWLDFNDRVLAEALDERTPLLERLKFLAIFTSNLDEFFMKRMAVRRVDATAAREKLRDQIRGRKLADHSRFLLPASGRAGADGQRPGPIFIRYPATTQKGRIKC